MQWKARRHKIEEAKVDTNKEPFILADIDRADEERLGTCNASAKKKPNSKPAEVNSLKLLLLNCFSLRNSTQTYGTRYSPLYLKWKWAEYVLWLK